MIMYRDLGEMQPKQRRRAQGGSTSTCAALVPGITGAPVCVCVCVCCVCVCVCVYVCTPSRYRCMLLTLSKPGIRSCVTHPFPLNHSQDCTLLFFFLSLSLSLSLCLSLSLHPSLSRVSVCFCAHTLSRPYGTSGLMRNDKITWAC